MKAYINQLALSKVSKVKPEDIMLFVDAMKPHQMNQALLSAIKYDSYMTCHSILNITKLKKHLELSTQYFLVESAKSKNTSIMKMLIQEPLQLKLLKMSEAAKKIINVCMLADDIKMAKLLEPHLCIISNLDYSSNQTGLFFRKIKSQQSKGNLENMLVPKNNKIRSVKI